MPYSVAYSLRELQNGKSRFGEDLRGHTIAKVDKDSKIDILYKRDVERWKNTFGKKALEKEIAIFQTIKKLK